jgi:hypothetical protein
MTQETVKKAKAHTRYTLEDGTRVPGVTTILNVIAKPALIAWSNRMGLDGINTSKYVDELADIGTLAHAMIAHHLGGPAPDLDDYSKNQISRAENSVLSFHEWAKGRKLVTFHSERLMVSEELCYGGQADWIGEIDGVTTLLDLKTGKAIYDEMLYQVAAYWNLAEEERQGIKEIRILQVGRSEDEGFSERIIPAASIPKYFAVFTAALHLYQTIKAAKRGS